MRATAILIGLTLLAGCERPPPPDAYRSLERRPFTVSIPDWPAEADEDGGLTGRYKVRRDQRHAEVSWTTDRSSDRAEMKRIGDNLMRGFDISDYWHEIDEAPGQLRLHLRSEIRPGIWLSQSSVRCIDAGVLVSLGALAGTMADAEQVREAMLASLACTKDDLSELRTPWPTTDLPPEFGVEDGEDLLLAHADGRWLRVLAWTPNQVDDIRGSPDKARYVLRSLGGMLELDLVTDGRPEANRNLSGSADVWRMRVEPKGTLVASAFTCRAARSGYIVLVGDLDGGTGLRDLTALSLRFGCPGRSAGRPVLEGRAGVCEAGAVEYCEAIGGAATEPAAAPPPAD